MEIEFGRTAKPSAFYKVGPGVHSSHLCIVLLSSFSLAQKSLVRHTFGISALSS